MISPTTLCGHPIFLDIQDNATPAALLNASGEHITFTALPDSMVRVFEYGVRLDLEALAAANDQISRSRALYNELIARMRAIFEEMSAWVLERAGGRAVELDAQARALSEDFDKARSSNNEDAMRAIAGQRSSTWKELASLMAIARKEHAAELRKRFYSRVGANATCDTYRLRCDAVDSGLGWATANDVLDRTLVAWRASMKQGRPPRFSRGDERTQDALTLQFTTAGGVDVERLKGGRHQEFQMQMPETGSGRRRYGTFKFRLGAAQAGAYATGTMQVHRGLPKSAATHVRLVRRRLSNKDKWAVQLVLKLSSPMKPATAPRHPLVAVHFGWAADVDGRRVAGIADAANPGLARLIQLPTTIEDDLRRASMVQAARDQARNEAAPSLKSLLVGLPANGAPETLDPLRDELELLKRLRTEHIAAKRFYRVQAMARRADLRFDWLDAWVALDRKRWQEAVGVARRARNRRRQFYRELALDLARDYTAMVIEPLDLKRAATKIDQRTGERNDFTRKARSGRTVAALHQFESELRKAARDYGRALFEMKGEMTVRRCAHCGAPQMRASERDGHQLICDSCGAVTDRMRAGAATAWQVASGGIQEQVVDFHQALHDAACHKATEALARKQRMAEGRAAARQRI